MAYSCIMKADDGHITATEGESMLPELELRYSDKEITPWGGMSLLQRLMQRLQFREFLSSLSLPRQGSNRGYAPEQLIEQFLIGVWCGANRFEHLEVTRYDAAIGKIFGYERMAGHKAFQRYFRKFTQGTNQRVFSEIYGWFFRQLTFDNFTLDLDSTIMSRYGQQEGARKGYNPQKPGRNSHHPLLAFVADCRMVANCWLRSGDAHTANNFEGFFADTLQKLSDKKIGLLRADSGFCQTSILKHLEQRQEPVPYIIAARLTPPLQRTLAAHRAWWPVQEGIEVASTEVHLGKDTKARRLVMVRQQVNLRPRASGKQLRLFPEDVLIRNYRYGCFVTNLSLPDYLIWKLYRLRADAENRIKELKYDFGADSFNLQNFNATEATMNFVMLAYNFMSLFRQAVLRTEVQPTMKTMRYQVFAHGASVLTTKKRRIINLALAMKARSWFNGLWFTAGSLCFPIALPLLL